MFQRVVAIAVALISAGPLAAADLAVSIADARHAPVADAVVSVVPANGTTPPAQRSTPETRTIDQKNEQFIPYVEIFRPGDSVVFHNSDQTRHHVYSFAPARQFEFVVTPGETSAPVRLDHPGSVAVGCNIHDRMITYLYISDAPWIARSGADGRATIVGLGPGDYTVHVWHPQQKPGEAEPVRTLHVGEGNPAPLAFTLNLLPDPRTRPDRERANY